MLHNAPLDVLKRVSSGIPKSVDNIPKPDLRAYITAALCLKNSEQISNLYLYAYLGNFRAERDKLECASRFPRPFFSRKTEERKRCDKDAEELLQSTLDSLRDTILKYRTANLKDADLLLGQPVKGIRILTQVDHARVNFYLTAIDYYEHNKITELQRLMLHNLPYLQLLCAVDLEKLSAIIDLLSYAELLAVSKFLENITLNRTGIKFLQTTKSLKKHVLKAISDLQTLNRSVVNVKLMKRAVSLIKSMKSVYPQADELVVLLSTVCKTEYVKVLGISKSGGARFSLKSAGLLLVMFFSFVFGIVFMLVTLPLQIIADSVWMFTRPREVGHDYVQNDEGYNEKAIDRVFISMVNRMATVYKWLPEKLLTALRPNMQHVQFVVNLPDP